MGTLTDFRSLTRSQFILAARVNAKSQAQERAAPLGRAFLGGDCPSERAVLSGQSPPVTTQRPPADTLAMCRLNFFVSPFLNWIS